LEATIIPEGFSPLKNLLFDRAGGDEAIDETRLLLTITPDTSQSLLIGCWIPICGRKEGREEAVSQTKKVEGEREKNSFDLCLQLTRIEQDETIGSDKIQTTTTSLGTEQEHEFWRFGIIEPVYQLLSLLYGHSPI